MRIVRHTALLALLLAAAVPAALRAQALPTPKAFVSNLDVRCYKIPNQPPINVPLRLDHLNPVFVQKQLPYEQVVLREPQDLCVPVYKDGVKPAPEAAPFIQFVDWKCYGISGPSLDLPLHLDHLNPVIAHKLGPYEDVIVREPQQLCVPVVKNNNYPPPAVQSLVAWLDVKCYRVDYTRDLNYPINLTHLNPLFSTLPSEDATLWGAGPLQLCVPEAKNQTYPPTTVLPIIQYSDVLCYPLRGLPLNRQLNLTHINPVLRGMGLPPEDVYVTDSDKLCVPVAKNGNFPPG